MIGSQAVPAHCPTPVDLAMVDRAMADLVMADLVMGGPATTMIGTADTITTITVGTTACGIARGGRRYAGDTGGTDTPR